MGASSSSIVTVLGLEVVALWTLSVLFAGVWWRGRDPGMAWLVAGDMPVSGPEIAGPAERLWAIVIGVAVLCVSAGVVHYLGVPQGAAGWLVGACGVPGLVLIVALAAGLDVSHANFLVGVLFAYLGAALLALKRAATEPGDGHALLGLALLSLVLMPIRVVGKIRAKPAAAAIQKRGSVVSVGKGAGFRLVG
jgi:hypothetical protein